MVGEGLSLEPALGDLDLRRRRLAHVPDEHTSHQA
jgi:hypothetical protein